MRDAAAPVDQSEDAEEKADGWKQKDQDSVAQGSAAMLA
jgi:hypothetical protein